MPILTKPGTLEKGTPASLTLNKTLLAAVSSVQNDDYFSDTTNWKFVKMLYRSSEGNQKYSAQFDCSQGSPTSSFITSEKARDIFEIQRIMIVDFDGGQFNVERNELNTSEFDLDYSPQEENISWTIFHPSDLSTYGSFGGLVSQPDIDSWNNGAYGSGISGDFTLTYKFIDMVPGNAKNFIVGYDIDTPTEGLSNSNAFRIYANGISGVTTSGDTWVDPLSGTFSTAECILIFTRVGSTITYSFNNGSTTQTGTVQTGNSGTIYPTAILYNHRMRLNYATVM